MIYVLYKLRQKKNTEMESPILQMRHSITQSNLPHQNTKLTPGNQSILCIENVTKLKFYRKRIQSIKPFFHSFIHSRF